ncbi:MAG: phosphoribosylformylglycinamidine synthase [Clostridiales bacterium]|jgi:phosphoribosylformylglycinamidine synthase|nr:phosphoribosylformylglycinamidine synthase [Clostridiales bacterium]
MDQIKRIYIEKKPGNNIIAAKMLQDITENLGITSVTHLRALSVFDISGITDGEYGKCKAEIFLSPETDYLYEEIFPQNPSDFVFGMAYKPGQFDQKADSARQCIEAVTGKENVVVKSSSVFVLSGNLTLDEKQEITQYCINPVDSYETPLEKPAVLDPLMPDAENVKTVEGFTAKSEAEVRELRKTMGLAMTDEDFLFCHAYFKEDEGRNPTETEIKVLDTYWSDHCRHSTFLTEIESVGFQDGPYKNIIENAYNMYIAEREKLGVKKKMSLMDIAVMGMKALKAQGKLPNLDESEEINACSVKIKADVNGRDEDWLLMFKNETHNHPTEIEPLGGASTCLGGAIRDPLAGRAYVYQAMRVTGSANPTKPLSETIPGKLPQRKITTTAAAGYSSYGNQIGVTSGYVNEIYHEGYAAKRMELGAVVGAVKAENVIRKRPEEGDVVLLVGENTGRDGLGGATGSSKEQSEEAMQTCAAQVQKGNPPAERKIVRLFRNPRAAKMIKRCNDFGAGGVSVAIGELADGLLIDLDKVPVKYNGLDGTELAISESQERMAVVVSKQDEAEFMALAESENTRAVRVAEVTSNNRLVMVWKGNKIVDLSREFLNTSGVTAKAGVYVTSPEAKGYEPVADASYLLPVLADINICSQKGLAEWFDSTIGNGSVLVPYGGVNQFTPIQAMAAKIPVENGETNTVSVMGYGYDPNLSQWSPFHGAVTAVVDSIAKIAASGADTDGVYLSFQEYFESLGKNDSLWGKPFAALLGGFYAQMKLGVASVGGKDSMSGSFKDINVPPTLVSFAISTAHAADIISPEFKNAGSKIVLLETKYDENGLPDLDEFKKNLKLLNKLIKEKTVVSAYTVGLGGVAAAIAKMSFGNFYGVKLNYGNLYGKKYGSFVLEVVGGADDVLSEANITVIGETTDKFALEINGEEINISNALAVWLSPLEGVFPTNYFKETSDAAVLPKAKAAAQRQKAITKIARPTVFIPVFPGTNGEYDMKKQFEAAGAKAEIFIVKNTNAKVYAQSVLEAKKLIKSAQIIAIPGGFETGDGFDGSGNFIAAFFRNQNIAEEVAQLLENRDGLILGISHGFGALLKTGLLPKGKITNANAIAALEINEIGRHVSRFARVKVINNNSPWYSNVNAGDIFETAISTGEGRFYADQATIKTLAENGQIAAQFADFAGDISADIKYNPTGSAYAIEAVTSPDGRVLGKIGHCERMGDNLFKNIPGDKKQKIFLAGVEYFG